MARGSSREARMRRVAERSAAMSSAVRDWFTSSALFIGMVDSAFLAIDLDNSGELDQLEVYCGVLLLYTKIIAYCPTARPPTKQAVSQMVSDLDLNRTRGVPTIDKTEFESLATLLCRQVASRLSVELAFALVIGPLLASVLLMAVDAVLPGGVLGLLVPALLPAWLHGMVDGMRTTVTVALVLAFAVPRLLSRVEYGHSRATEPPPPPPPPPGEEGEDDEGDEALKKAQ